MKRKQRDIVHRWEGNPAITLNHLSFSCNNMYNAGAVKIGNEYLLLLTIESLEGKTSIYKATSPDGYHFDVESKPFLSRRENEEFGTYEEMGVKDARITLFDNRYYISYVVEGGYGILLCLAVTDDFKKVDKIGIVSEPDTKAGALFPKKFNGKYARLERPKEGGAIWISYSKDLFTWGEKEIVLPPRHRFWDTDHVGCAAPPIEIDDGWLLTYYSVKMTSAGPITRIGAAILDKKNPNIVTHRSNVPILSPREDYERIGDMGNLVFSTGMILEENRELKIYYGAAENCLCVGTVKLDDIIECCLESSKEY